MGSIDGALDAIRVSDWSTVFSNGTIILVFIAGCVAGLISFSKLLNWLFKKAKNFIVALLVGFLIGSLNKIWPWKIATAFRINSAGEQVPTFTKNVWPAEYIRLTGEPALILQAIFFMALGIFIVVLIEKIAHRRSIPHI